MGRWSEAQTLKIFKNAWFARFARREGISAAALLDAVARAENSQIDADLGGGVIKQRIARSGEGKSKGFRSIILFRKGKRAVFVFGFPKSAIDNIAPNEMAQFKKLAWHLLSLSDTQVNQLLSNRQIEVVEHEA